MDNMLRAVLETDHHESERTEQLIKTREMLFEEMRAQKEALFAAARDAAKEDIAAIAQRTVSSREERITALLAQGDAALRKLTEYGNARYEKWADEIVRLVLEA
ncbi:MAG: hypothetical protein LBJ12_09060 [Oscillospiraceae bacterium]|jgi:NACalpha-BTF3-like transcription factor|nr:hypothetical protein [Oscillospiraceae bacterium]